MANLRRLCINTSCSDIPEVYSKAEIDEMLEHIETLDAKVVTELPPVGEKGVIYLLDTGDGYEQWIWTDDGWVNMGGVQIDLSAYVQYQDLTRSGTVTDEKKHAVDAVELNPNVSGTLAKNLADAKAQIASQLNNNYRGTLFRFGVDSSGNYGYIKAGADTVTPFKSQADVDAAYTRGYNAGRAAAKIAGAFFGRGNATSGAYAIPTANTNEIVDTTLMSISGHKMTFKVAGNYTVKYFGATCRNDQYTMRYAVTRTRNGSDSNIASATGVGVGTYGTQAFTANVGDIIFIQARNEQSGSSANYNVGFVVYKT